ncbi:MAG: hypothetical protein V1926_02205 [Candidatus Peregrinibacteria bacterium]
MPILKHSLRSISLIALLAVAPSAHAYLTPGEAFDLGENAPTATVLPSPSRSGLAQSASTPRTFYRNGKAIDVTLPEAPTDTGSDTEKPAASADTLSGAETGEEKEGGSGALSSDSGPESTSSQEEIPAGESGAVITDTTPPDDTGGQPAAESPSLFSLLPLWQLILFACALVIFVAFIFLKRKKRFAVPAVQPGQNTPVSPVVQQAPEDSSARLEKALQSLQSPPPAAATTAAPSNEQKQG